MEGDENVRSTDESPLSGDIANAGCAALRPSEECLLKKLEEVNSQLEQDSRVRFPRPRKGPRGVCDHETGQRPVIGTVLLNILWALCVVTACWKCPDGTCRLRQ